MTLKFDYIIIGAGSAGCVLANRLSSNGRNSVLVLEAGCSDRKFWVQTPIGYGKTFYDKQVNWGYHTEPEAGLNNRVSYWPRGKIVGGSSSIKALVYIRGQQRDYNDWLTADGLHNCVVRNEEMTSEELVRICDDARRRFYLRPGYIAYKLGQLLRHPREIMRTAKAARVFAKHLFLGSRV